MDIEFLPVYTRTKVPVFLPKVFEYFFIGLQQSSVSRRKKEEDDDLDEDDDGSTEEEN